MPKEIYIKALQDGVVRIDQDTKPNIAGLFTSNLQTCYALIFVGENNSKISLCHFTWSIGINSILQEFNWAGRPKQIYIFRNFDFIKKLYAKTFNDIREVELKINLDKICNCNCSIFDAPNGFVSVTRDGKINIETRPQIAMLPIQPAARLLRNSINNWFLKPNEKMKADREFYDNHWSLKPNFFKTEKEIAELEKQKKYYNSTINYLLNFSKHDNEAIELLNIEELRALNQISGLEFAAAKDCDQTPEMISAFCYFDSEKTQHIIYNELTALGLKDVTTDTESFSIIRTLENQPAEYFTITVPDISGKNYDPIFMKYNDGNKIYC